MPRKLTKEEAQRIAKIRHAKKTPAERTAWAIAMNEKRWSRGIIPKDKEAETPSKDNT